MIQHHTIKGDKIPTINSIGREKLNFLKNNI